MSSNQLGKQLLFYILCLNLNANSMQNLEAENLNKETSYLSQYIHYARSYLMEAIRARNIVDCQRIINELKEHITYKQFWLVLDTFDKEQCHSPLSLAKKLPKGSIKREIITILKTAGATHAQDTKYKNSLLEALDNRFHLMQTTLINTIQTGCFEKVQRTLKSIYDELVNVIETDKGYFTNKLPFIVLISEAEIYSGHTPLTLATINGFLAITQLLLDFGANPLVCNKKGDKPKELITILNDEQAQSFLKVFDTKNNTGVLK